MTDACAKRAELAPGQEPGTVRSFDPEWPAVGDECIRLADETEKNGVVVQNLGILGSFINLLHCLTILIHCFVVLILVRPL